ncbi:hypothetical protein CORC01_12890 [Colletotrichum orchidophilum]|uniref:Uncharacterized protein n=1 Tax=Colletotrichum orchidophilum TaxID=1209926 RepID=A0A1G4ART1_9PEZI|nr:uncharacterized protein CORC01_12890 [Colletotrichum orchidophilum]OHE91816.1 hypothetical protein CORC01_12890 [Colletotrichum orchidophilum]
MLPEQAFYEAAVVLILRATSRFSDPTVNTGKSWIPVDNDPFLRKKTNYAQIPWTDVQTAFKNTSRADVAIYPGVDWTKPLSSSPIDVFQAHLQIASDVPFPEVKGGDSVTELTAITYSLPEVMMNKGAPKAMDLSWGVCQHYFITNQVDPTVPVDNDCGFLPDDCRADLESSLTEEWGISEPSDALFQFAHGLTICLKTGRSTSVTFLKILSYDFELLKDEEWSKTLLLPEVTESSWMIGTGYSDADNVTANYTATNRTHIIGTVFGYLFSVEEHKRERPSISLACLRPECMDMPQPTESTTDIT